MKIWLYAGVTTRTEEANGTMRMCARLEARFDEPGSGYSGESDDEGFDMWPAFVREVSVNELLALIQTVLSEKRKQRAREREMAKPPSPSLVSERLMRAEAEGRLVRGPEALAIIEKL